MWYELAKNQVLMIDEALVIYFILDLKWIYWNLGLMIDEALVRLLFEMWVCYIDESKILRVCESES